MGNYRLQETENNSGKAFALGKLAHSVFFGLPGNPVSAMVTLYQLAVQTMQIMDGFSVN